MLSKAPHDSTLLLLLGLHRPRERFLRERSRILSSLASTHACSSPALDCVPCMCILRREYACVRCVGAHEPRTRKCKSRANRVFAANSTFPPRQGRLGGYFQHFDPRTRHVYAFLQERVRRGSPRELRIGEFVGSIRKKSMQVDALTLARVSARRVRYFGWEGANSREFGVLNIFQFASLRRGRGS